MLKQRAIKAIVWSGIDIFLRQIFSFVVSLILVRLIAPDEFGILALTMLFTGVAGALTDGGLAAALIQRKETTHCDESTVFWFNFAIGALTTLMLFVVAPWAADYLSQEVLAPLLKLISLSVFISALGSIHSVRLQKQLDFRTQMFVGTASTVSSGLVAIWLALYGYGVWALAWQQVVSAICTVVLLWTLHPWRPTLVFSTKSAHKLFSFGGYILATNLIDTAFSRLYTIVIGKLFGVRDLGFYSRADSTQQLPAGFITQIMLRVAFPVFSVAAENSIRLRHGVELAVRGVMLINAPTMLGIAAVSEPLVITMFGARWSASASILQVLCLAGILRPLHRINLTVLVAQGHSRLFFKLEVIKKLLGIALLVSGATMGVMGVAWAMVAFSLAEFYINAWYVARYFDYGVAKQTNDIAPIIVLSSLMAIFVHGLGSLLHFTAPVELVLQVVIGVAFMGVFTPLFRLRALGDVIDLIRQYRQRKSC